MDGRRDLDLNGSLLWHKRLVVVESNGHNGSSNGIGDRAINAEMAPPPPPTTDDGKREVEIVCVCLSSFTYLSISLSLSLDRFAPLSFPLLVHSRTPTLSDRLADVSPFNADIWLVAFACYLTCWLSGWRISDEEEESEGPVVGRLPKSEIRRAMVVARLKFRKGSTQHD